MTVQNERAKAIAAGAWHTSLNWKKFSRTLTIRFQKEAGIVWGIRVRAERYLFAGSSCCMCRSCSDGCTTWRIIHTRRVAPEKLMKHPYSAEAFPECKTILVTPDARKTTIKRRHKKDVTTRRTLEYFHRAALHRN